MAEAFLGEIRLFAFTFAPKGWALCNGQFLPINQNQALFALLGTTYGGDGQQTFALPNLQGRMPVGAGNGFNQGQSAGEETHSLSVSELPAHTHAVAASDAPGASTSPAGQLWARDSGGNTVFSSGKGAVMSPAAIANAGGSQPHQNMMPFLTASFCIALQGIFPSRN